MNIPYKLFKKSQFSNYEIFNKAFREIADDEDDISPEDFQAFSNILSTIDRNLQSDNVYWIKQAVDKLIDLTKLKNAALNHLIINSDAFSTLCSNFSSVYLLSILRISLNLTAKSPYIVYVLINSNIIFTIFENLKSAEGQIILTCLKIITNMINSSLFSRICLVSSGFFQYAFNFLKSPNRLNDLHYMGKLVEYIIACFFDPSISSNSNSYESQSLGLNDPQNILDLLDQTQQQLSSDTNNYTLNMDAASQILLNNNKLILDGRDPLWDVLICMINKPDSYLMGCGLKSLCRFSQNPDDAIFIFNNTSLFDNCKSICSRNNPIATQNLFRLFSQFFYVADEKANKKFIRNGLFEVVVRYFDHQDKSVRISAIECISNCLCFQENQNLINAYFTDEVIMAMISKARDDFIFLKEKEDILFLLVNLALIDPQVRLMLFSQENMELMIDFLSLSSKEYVVLLLDVLSNLIETQNNYNIDFLDLFIQCNGIEAVENLLDHQLEYVAQSAQVFYDAYLRDI